MNIQSKISILEQHLIKKQDKLPYKKNIKEKNMKRFLILLCMMISFSCIYAQEAAENTQSNQAEDEYIEGDDDTSGFEFGTTLAGDQYIRISLGVDFPMNFPDFSSLFQKDKSQLKIGGIGFLGYHYFITNNIALGVDVGFGFNVSIGSHVFNYVPVIFEGTYQFTKEKFEFPITAGIGFAWENFNSQHYFPGLVLKLGGGAHYRVTESWSLGLEASYMFMPQFCALYDKNAENRMGHYTTIDLVARYIF